MTPMTLTPEHNLPTRTAADWDAIARAHIQAIGNGGFTPTQDYRLMEGLALGYGLPAVAYSVGVTPNAAADRFRALRSGMVTAYGTREVFSLDAQEALVRALRGRLN